MCKELTDVTSSRMRVMNHNWSATKQHLHPQSIAEISRHSVLSVDRIRQCETSSESRHKDTKSRPTQSPSSLYRCHWSIITVMQSALPFYHFPHILQYLMCHALWLWSSLIVWSMHVDAGLLTYVSLLYEIMTYRMRETIKCINPLMGTLKLQSYGPLYCSMVMVHWLLMGELLHLYSEEGPGWAAALPSPLLAVPNVTATHKWPVYQLHIIRCGTMITFALYKGLICG